MKRILPYILIIITLVLNATPTSADTEFQLTQFTTADGLPNNTIRCITQDSEGNLWICTSNGLSMYDGKAFHNFHPSANGTTVGLADQRTQKVFEHEGCIWIATANGNSCYDLKLHSFIDYNKRGLSVPTFPKYTIHRITDSLGRTWKVTDEDGLYIINNKSGETEHFCTTTKNNPLPTNALKCIFQDKDGVIWIGTDNLGISQLKIVQNDGVNYMLEGENIRMISRISKDKIAVANRSGITWTYDSLLTKQISTSKKDKNTYCSVIDKDGNLWEGTKGAGLFINGTAAPDSLYKDIYALFEDANGEMWVGTFGAGLFHGDESYLKDDDASMHIRSLIEDKDRNLWVGTSNGVYILTRDRKTLRHTVRKHLTKESGELLSNEIRTLFKDSRGNIYIAETGEGFAVINQAENLKNIPHSIRHYTENDSLVNTMVQSFVEDKEGFVWIATEFGVSKLNPTTGVIKSYFFSKNMINNVYSENCGILLDDGRIAFGTNNGIILITPAVYNHGEKTTNITADDITVNGQRKGGIVYVVSKWWKTPWAIASYVLIILSIMFILRRIRHKNLRLYKAIKELNKKKDILTTENEQLSTEKEKLTSENEQLSTEKEKLTNENEQLSTEKEKLTTENEQLSTEKEKLTNENEQLSTEKEKLSSEKEEIKELYSSEVKIKREEELSALDEEFIQEMEAIANAEMANPNFSSDDFANQMGMGRTVFFKKMKKITGYSPKEYIKLKRIKRAAELISTTTTPIGEIGFSVGIEDPLYFSRVFKQTYGMTPTEWRKGPLPTFPQGGEEMEK